MFRCRTDHQLYQGLLGFPLTELFENRDYAGSTHFFFDIGNGNCLLFDMPGLGLGDYQEVLGGHHHLAISMTPNEWNAARDRLEAAGWRRLMSTARLYTSLAQMASVLN